jgi:DNA polymerase I-like protein with 3'-5' exonuclease and polymerase domains
MKPVTHEGYKLLHKGTLALSKVEHAGIHIDTEYLKKSIKKTKKKIKRLTAGMKADEIYEIWRKHFGQKTNIGSNEQLGKILYDVLDYPITARTKKGKAKVDAAAFGQIDLPFVSNFIKLEKLKKACTTYLEGILNETTNGILRPFFNLGVAVTYRSSSSSPNFQNQPIRDALMAKLIRQAFIARKNHRIVEVDYGGVEICGAACYHLDPRMIKYIMDETKDLHRDMARQIYMLSKKEMKGRDKEDAKRVKKIRYCSKNKFVFPEFYGDWYMSCATSLWEAIEAMNLCTRDGYNLYSNLEKKGIYKLGACDPKEDPKEGTFELHLKEIEDDFWNRRFKIYNQWKNDWYFEYLKRGYFDTLTGFRIEGVMSKKETINYPVQGTAFHWLLWSLIRIQKLLKKYKMKSLIIGQIHDSIVSDVHKKELKDYLEIVQQVMTVDIRKHWPWIIVPLTIEAEASPVNGNWYQKEEVKI